MYRSKPRLACSQFFFRRMCVGQLKEGHRCIQDHLIASCANAGNIGLGCILRRPFPSQTAAAVVDCVVGHQLAGGSPTVGKDGVVSRRLLVLDFASQSRHQCCPSLAESRFSQVSCCRRSFHQRSTCKRTRDAFLQAERLITACHSAVEHTKKTYKPRCYFALHSNTCS